jgi:hypothetical protein
MRGRATIALWWWRTAAAWGAAAGRRGHDAALQGGAGCDAVAEEGAQAG